MSAKNTQIVHGMIAGLLGTVVLSALMMAKGMMGVMPDLDPVHMLSDMIAQKMGMEPNMIIGWVMHFMIGSVAWGGAFAAFNNALPGSSQIAKGISLGVAAWFMMMIGPMPMSGAGLFGLNIGAMASVMTFVFHIVFGVVMGKTFEKLHGVE